MRNNFLFNTKLSFLPKGRVICLWAGDGGGAIGVLGKISSGGQRGQRQVFFKELEGANFSQLEGQFLWHACPPGPTGEKVRKIS